MFVVFTFTTQIACYTFLTLGFYAENGILWFLLAALCYFINWCYGSGDYGPRLLKNKIQLDECMGSIKNAIKNPPRMFMIIQKYKMEERTRTN